MSDLFRDILAIIVVIVASARLTRLLTADSFPPIVWLRIKWDNLTDGSDWNKLFHCHWCMSFWMTALVVLTGWLSELHLVWWLVFGTLAASYLAAMLVERDEVGE